MARQTDRTITLTGDELDQVARAATMSAQVGAQVRFPDDAKRSQWLAERKASALLLDPATAEITSTMALTRDPYGVHSELHGEFDQVGREYFARDPKGQVLVWFGDLPDRTHQALWKRIANPHVIGFGGVYEVRSSRQAKHLILLPHNIDTHRFVLMHVTALRACEFAGWCWGAEGKKPEYWHAPASGRPAYFVPLNALRFEAAQTWH